MFNILLRLIGWRATLFFGTPCFFDRWKWLNRYLLAGPLKTLDAGCGVGSFTIYASKIGNQSIGVSLNEECNKRARGWAEVLKLPNAQFITARFENFEKLSRQFGKFDQIICFETIEHIQNDNELVKNLSDSLKPGGRLILTAPFKNHKPLFGEEDPRFEGGPHGHERSGYSLEEIKDLFKKNELDILAEGYISGFISQKLTSLMRKIIVKTNFKIGLAATFPLRVFQIMDRPLTKFIGYPYLTVGVVGIKR